MFATLSQGEQAEILRTARPRIERLPLRGGRVAHVVYVPQSVAQVDSPDPQAERINHLQDYCTKHLHDVPGNLLPFAEFYAAYKQAPDLPAASSHQSIGRLLKTLGRIPTGRNGGKGTIYLGNVSFDPSTAPSKPYVLVGGRLYRGAEV